MKRLVALCIISSVLAACSGRSGNVLPAHFSTPSKTGTAKFTIKWPSKTRHAATSPRHPYFISPSAQSVIVSVNPNASPAGPATYVNISSASGNPPTSTVTIDAPVGQDEFLIQVYDQPQTSAAQPAGNLLGQTDVTQTINVGVLNTVNATVDGVVSSLTLTPLPNQPTAETQSGGYGIVGTTPVTFQLNALDADGNVIVPPGNAPTLSLSSDSSSLTATPLAGSTNQYTLQVTAPLVQVQGFMPPTFPNVTASAVDSSGNAASAVIDITPLSAVYVAYASGGVALFDAQGNMLALPSTAFGGVQNGIALAYDYDDNRVFVADSAQNKLFAFDALGNPISGFTAPSVAGINGVTYDSHTKVVYVTGNSGISMFTVNGAATGTNVTLSNSSGIAFVSTDISGNPLNQLAVGIGGSSPVVAMLSESGSQVSSFPLAGAPTAVAYRSFRGVDAILGIAQQIYVVRSGNIDAFSTSGNQAGTVADSNTPFGVAVDPNLYEPYVTEQTTNAVVPYTTQLSGVDTASTQIQVPASSSFKTPVGTTIAY